MDWMTGKRENGRKFPSSHRKYPLMTPCSNASHKKCRIKRARLSLSDFPSIHATHGWKPNFVFEQWGHLDISNDWRKEYHIYFLVLISSEGGKEEKRGGDETWIRAQRKKKRKKPSYLLTRSDGGLRKERKKEGGIIAIGVRVRYIRENE